MKFKVVAIFTFNGYVERREVEEFDSVTAAFERFGYYAGRSNGVLVLDEHDCVWGEFAPSQINMPTHEQHCRYQLYLDRKLDAA